MATLRALGVFFRFINVKNSVYVGCGLTGSSTEYQNFIRKVIESLGEMFNINFFYSFASESKGDNVFVFDQSQILKSDALIAFIDCPSTELGMEIMMAYEKGKRIVFVANQKSKFSKMVLHFAQTYQLPIIYYEDDVVIPDLVNRISAVLSKS